MNNVVTAIEARRRFGEILNNAFYRGASTTIERKGKPVARIVPLMDDTLRVSKNIALYAGIWKNKRDILLMKREALRLRRKSLRSIRPL